MTAIQWTDETWNPTRGCSRVSSGCDNCYAIRQAVRQDRPGGAYAGLTKMRTRLDWSGKVAFAGQDVLEKPLRWKRPRRVFVDSMSDLFHEALAFHDIAHVFLVMESCPQHTFQVLTKRPHRFSEWGAWAASRFRQWPLPNVWLGVSCEDQATADERIPLLLQTPAAVHFVSAEPLLGPISFDSTSPGDPCASSFLSGIGGQRVYDGAKCALDWIIVGGESGPGARPCDVDWIRSIVQECSAAGVACFVKQLGGLSLWDGSGLVANNPRCRMSRGAWHGLEATRLHLDDRKGGDPSQWPEDLRVREFPA